ncbi:hypothetical protein F53441_840 [Fusarium austroafricanum]|uniref:Uncharacterized protein n=1 Tax=Fusarium austroafricanum TaxID=2364996 RepID=A0A8H4KVY8_9HYPO|nr:hypothetical protein F53441_840 [Fusarium austroafricanum]
MCLLFSRKSQTEKVYDYQPKPAKIHYSDFGNNKAMGSNKRSRRSAPSAGHHRHNHSTGGILGAMGGGGFGADFHFSYGYLDAYRVAECHSSARFRTDSTGKMASRIFGLLRSLGRNAEVCLPVNLEKKPKEIKIH